MHSLSHALRMRRRCVYVVLWAYTGSALLSLLGLIQVILAFPITLFVYSVVLRIKLFGVLQVRFTAL